MPPLIRARHPQMLLELLAERHPAVHARVMPGLACAEKLTHALPVEWIPVEMDVEVIEAVSAVLPAPPMAELVAERQRREMGSALFKTFVSTAQKLFGLSPATILRHLGRGWSQVFSQCGEIAVLSIAEHEGVVAVRALPAACLSSEAWLAAIPAGMQALFELVNSSGSVTAARRDSDVELRFRW